MTDKDRSCPDETPLETAVAEGAPPPDGGGMSLVEALLASERRFRATFEQAAVGVAHVGLDGRWLRVNRRLCEIVGYPREELVQLTFQDITHPDDLETDLEQMVRLMKGEIESYSMEKRYVRRDGSLVWINLTGSCVRQGDGTPEYFISVVEDIDARKRAEESLDFLADTGRLLVASLDLDVLLENLVRLALPRLGDYAVIDLVDEAGAVIESRTAHALPEKEALAREYRRRYPPGPHNPGTPVWRVLLNREPIVARDVPASFVDDVAQDESQARLLHALRPRSFLIQPLVAMGRTVGAMSFCVSESDRQYSEADLELARELAGRAAVALENALLHRHAKERLVAAEQARGWTERLQALTADFGRALHPAEVAALVAERVKATVGAAAGGVLLVTADGRELEMVPAEGWDAHPDIIRAWHRIPMADGLPAVDAIRARTLLTIESLADFHERYPAIAPLMERAGYAACVVIPLDADGEAIGTLNYHFAGTHRFTDEERGFLTALGQQAAQALHRASLFAAEAEARERAERASRDAARALEQAERAREEAERARKEAQALAASVEEANQELARAAAAAEAANKAKSEFLRVMSHELRTPLNAIAGYAELLEAGVHGPVTDSQQKALSRIRASQHHLLGIVDGVLTFQRIEAGRLEFTFEEVTTSDALAGLDELVAAAALAGDVALDIRTSECSTRVRVDREKVRQVVLNLLDNAVKFTPRGGRVRVWCEELPDAAVIHVQDTGVGIAGDRLDSIFRPFVQVDMGLTRQHGGTGLGLAIGRRFAEGMGGALSVSSEPGRGSTFRLRLPRP
jgi:PAS domain S-box-containing protein